MVDIQSYISFEWKKEHHEIMGFGFDISVPSLTIRWSEFFQAMVDDILKPMRDGMDEFLKTITSPIQGAFDSLKDAIQGMFS